MIEHNKNETKQTPIVNRMDCKNYVKCLVKFGNRCFKSDKNDEISCVNCRSFDKK